MLAELIMFAIATVMLGLNMFGIGNPAVIFWVWVSIIMWYCAIVGDRR